MNERVPEITIDMDKKCVECGHGGAAGSGICLKCLSQILRRVPMRSDKGKAIARKILQEFRK